MYLSINELNALLEIAFNNSESLQDYSTPFNCVQDYLEYKLDNGQATPQDVSLIYVLRHAIINNKITS